MHAGLCGKVMAKPRSTAAAIDELDAQEQGCSKFCVNSASPPPAAATSVDQTSAPANDDRLLWVSGSSQPLKYQPDLG